jgi:mono/diheme cytochrome c family protein
MSAMRRWTTLAGCVATTLILTVIIPGCAAVRDNGRCGFADSGSDLIETGRRAYLEACASCHGSDARGDGPAASALRVPPPDLTHLTERAEAQFPRAHVIQVISGEVPISAHGSPEMPVWSRHFACAEGSGAAVAASIYAQRWVNALVAYLESVQSPTR